MNRKALLVLIPLLSMLSLLVTPAFATTYPNTEASGWAYVKTSEGCISGCATLEVVFGLAPGEVPAITDTLGGGFVLLVVHGHGFEWVIDLSSVKISKCNVLTLCASPYAVDDPVASNPIVFSTPLSPITVVIDLSKPYCVTAFGCSTLFIGQGHTLID
ncbi:MAG: hypothetical protein ABSF44_12410 [Candidatus Bathyarchaeia archaeon]|jgi:hypothetical protein